MKGHWSRICHTLKHLAELYQASIKKKEKDTDTNFVYQSDDMNEDPSTSTHMDVSDFFNPEGGV